MKNDKILTKKESKDLAKATMDWCLNKFGNPLKTLNPSLKVSFNKRNVRNYGLYYNRTVIVFPNVCQTRTRIIKTVIHEYCHFLQMPKLSNLSRYSKLYDKYGYYEHPLEIEARNFENEHYRSCWNSLKRKGVI